MTKKKKLWSFSIFKTGFSNIKKIYKLLSEKDEENELKASTFNMSFIKFLWCLLTKNWEIIIIPGEALIPDGIIIIERKPDKMNVIYFTFIDHIDSLTNIGKFASGELSKLALYDTDYIFVKINEHDIKGITVFKDYLGFKIYKRQYFKSKVTNNNIILLYKDLSYE